MPKFKAILLKLLSISLSLKAQLDIQFWLLRVCNQLSFD